MKKRLLSMVVAVVLILCAAPIAQAAELENPFSDVSNRAYYRDAVLWAYNAGVTSGTSATTFEPDSYCTRGQVVTFLWRASGSPEPASLANHFVDVAAGAYYHKAVLWAVEKGITTGTSSTTFSPNDRCTEAQVLTFLWRSKGSPAAAGHSTLASRYPGQYYEKALAWADTCGVLDWTPEVVFANDPSPRKNIVSYLYNCAGRVPVGVWIDREIFDSITALVKEQGKYIVSTGSYVWEYTFREQPTGSPVECIVMCPANEKGGDPIITFSQNCDGFQSTISLKRFANGRVAFMFGFNYEQYGLQSTGRIMDYAAFSYDGLTKEFTGTLEYDEYNGPTDRASIEAFEKMTAICLQWTLSNAESIVFPALDGADTDLTIRDLGCIAAYKAIYGIR